MARALDVAVTAWSPTGSGLLSGKYTAAERAGVTACDGSFRRLDSFEFTELSERNLGIARQTSELARQLGHTPAQLALAWVRERGVIPVIGARTNEQMLENLAALELELEPAVLEQLEVLTRPERSFPHSFLSRPAISAGVYGGMLERIDSHRPQQLPDYLGGTA